MLFKYVIITLNVLIELIRGKEKNDNIDIILTYNYFKYKSHLRWSNKRRSYRNE